jgi:DNA-binding NtrC family response regulator
LVLTDEVMPRMSGNQLCDRVHAMKPGVKFILLTGNPNNQDDLLYQTMRKNRFYEFLRKPLDLENRYDELLNLFESVLGPAGKRK